MQFRLIHINIFIIFLLIISLNLVDATTIYVNETGWWVNKFNSSSTPIKDAVEYAKENDTVFVVKGNYSENVIINKSISLISNGSRVTAKNPKKNVITIEDTSNVTVSGFTIFGTYTDYSGIKIYNASNCTIENCTLFKNGNGVYVRGTGSNPSKYNKILNCKIYKNDNGVKLSGNGCANNSIRFNNVSYNNIGIHSTMSDYNEIKNNDILYNVIGVYLKSKSINHAIEFNNFNNTEWNIYNNQSYSVVAKNNYWYSQDAQSIDKKIYDDEEGAGKVTFQPFLSDPDPVNEFSTMLLTIAGLLVTIGSFKFKR